MSGHVNPLLLDADDPAHRLSAAYACLLEQGLDGAGEALRLLVNQASLIEREQFIGVSAYERGAGRAAHGNGFKNKTMLTRVGKIGFSVPQVREGGFYPSARERGARSERAMNLALAEMYVQGISTHKMITVLQKLVGSALSISSTQISRCNATLDEGLAAWRTRPLGNSSGSAKPNSGISGNSGHSAGLMTVWQAGVRDEISEEGDGGTRAAPQVNRRVQSESRVSRTA